MNLTTAQSARFWAKVSKTDDCWVWFGATNSKGYGCLGVDGRGYLAHRVAYAEEVGPIPDGMQINHICGIKPCVRPDHLEVVDASGNIRHARGTGLMAPSLLSQDNSTKLICRNGHPYSPDNTYVNPQGHRVCRTCKRQSDRRRTERRSA